MVLIDLAIGVKCHTVATNGGAQDVFSTSGTYGLNINGQTVTFNVARGTDPSVDLLVSGIIGLGNGGGLVKNGSGIMALTATNNYAGATTINAGTLQLGNGGATGSIPGSAVSGSAGATLAFDLSTSSTFSNTISGGLGVTQAGSGTTVLTGNNSFTGPVTVNGGTLAVSGNNLNLSSTNITINSGGTFQVAGQRYNISNGTLFNFGASGGGTLDSSITFAQSQGGFFLSGGITVATNGGARDVLSTSGTYGLNMNGQTITFNVARGTDPSVDLQVSGILGQGSGAVVKNGSGIMALTATNNYSGATTVNAGTLLVSGSISGTVSASVASGAALEVDGLVNSSATISNTGGTLQGTGSVGPVTLNSGATLAPGFTTAGFVAGSSLTAGSVTFSDTASALSIGLGFTTGSDSTALASNGTVTLDKTPLELTLGNAINNPALVNTAVYVLLNGGAGSTGSGTDLFTYNGTTLANGQSFTTPGGFTFEILYDKNAAGTGSGSDVDLELTAVPEPATWATVLAGSAMLVGIQRCRRRGRC